MDVLAFQRKWIDASRQKERSAYVTHFNDLCELLGVEKPLDQDPTGETYGFERGSRIAGGGDGWADVWYKSHFAWEYKGIGKDLDAAYIQLLRYKDDLGNPPLLIVSDLNIIRIHTNFTNTVKQTIELNLVSLPGEGNLAMLKRLWTDPEGFRPKDTPDSVTIAAAKRFSEIAAGLYQRGEDPEKTAHFLVQIVFCLFAEDIALLPDRLFSQMVEADRLDPATFREDAQDLLEAMNTGGRVNYKRIPWVNGGLFATVDVPELTIPEIALIRDSMKLDWSQIEPAIFGTLFERSLDPTKRSQLGAHYTGKADIQRVVEPVVIAPLKHRWADLRDKYVGPDPVSGRSSKTSSSRADTRRRNAMLRDIDAFLAELRSVTILDPACGSGNFLYVALSELLTLEKEVMTWRATTATLPLGFPEIRPTQVKGIEINAYAQQLAQAAIWIGYLQWLNANGFGWSEPVLAALDSIEHKDALLAFHDDGTFTEAEWPRADFIIGNPPFLGGKRLRAELDDDYVDNLFDVFDGKVARESDLCCYFFEKARAQIEWDEAQRAGLLATQTIRVGANREVLRAIKRSGDIYMGWSDEPWILNGAAVRISIVGFDDGTSQARMLDGLEVTSINADLTASGVDVLAAQRLSENMNLAFQGDTKGGPFEIGADLAQDWIAFPPNPNGRPNTDVVRSWFNGRDVMDRPRNMWIIDFGTDMSESEASMYEAPYEYSLRHIKPARLNSKSTTGVWWLHERPRREMREALEDLSRYVGTARVARHRVFVWLAGGTIPDNRLAAIARDDDYFLGILSSQAHLVWALRLGARHGVGNDPVYMPTTCFETFPLPWPPGQEPVDDPRVIAIGDAAKKLDELRTNWLNPEGAPDAELKKRTLTNLYNAKPTWLQNAHAALDRAVWDAYGWPGSEVPADVQGDVILSRLLELNQERANPLT